MKKLVLTLCSIFLITTIASAQTKTEYCDVYVRGGAAKLKVTILHQGKAVHTAKRVNLGEILTIMENNGWEREESIVIPRHSFFSLFTRHKIHFIMKKECKKGENPYATLRKEIKSSPKK